MHAAGKALTVLLALLVTLSLPISAGICRSDLPGCCCGSQNCRCQISASETQTPQPTNPAVAPATKGTHDAIVSSLPVGAVPVAGISQGTVARALGPLVLNGPRLYALSHAFLI